LEEQIEDFQVMLPRMQEFSKDSIRDRHWQEVATILHASPDMDFTAGDFKLQSLLDLSIFPLRRRNSRR
jgi:dynein heavy chain